MKIRSLFSLLALVTLLAGISMSCDYVDDPKPDVDDGGGTVDTTGTILDSNMTFTKKVLLEDFTGHACGNCPRAHEKGEELYDLYGHDLVIVALHSGFFADPSGTIHGPNYTADYNSDISNAVDDHYSADNAGFPKGLIDRREYNGNALTNYPDWGAHVSTRLAEEPVMGIRVTSDFTSSSNLADITVEIEYKQAGTNNDYLVVLITEDSIQSHQKDYSLSPQDIPDYQHRHVARKAVTSSVWGERLSNDPIAIGDQFVVSYDNVTLDAGWNPEKCYVVAFVCDGTTKEVWNTDETSVVSE